MTKQQVELAAKVQRMLFARDAFHYTKISADHLMRLEKGKENPIYYPLLVGMCVTYAKPFSKCFGIGKLDDSMVPKNLKHLHEHLLLFRNKCYAHLDVGEEIANSQDIDIKNRVYLRVQNGEAQLVYTRLFTKMAALDRIAMLCSKLISKCTYHIERFHKTCSYSFPQESGYYVLESSQDAAAIFRRAERNETPWPASLREFVTS